MFGGGTVIGRSLRAEVAHNIFAVIKVDEICEEAGCNAKCSPGTYVSGKVCAVCAKGTYSSGLDNQQCSICPSGTYNDNFGSSSSEQCLPCPQGTYTDSNGSQTCLTCPIGKYCPVGSSHPVDNFNYISSSSLQPRLFHKKNLYLSLFIYQILVSVPIIIVLVICIIIPKCRVKILKFDMFDTSHENTENNYVITKKTLMGGFFSIIYIIGTFLLIGSTFISYIEDNIQESKALIPLVVLESEVGSIKSQELSVQLWLDLYGGQCEENSRCLPSTLISFTGLSCENFTYSCELTSKNSCKIVFKCLNADINQGSHISFSFLEKLSYTSGIRINLTSSSSIPDQISSVYLAIRPSLGKVFIGVVASDFFFIATPSLFKSEPDEWPDRETGYHISSGSSIKTGNQVSPESLPSVSYLFINVFIETSNSGLFTSRTYKQDALFCLSIILGSASGLFGITAMLMSQFEKRFYRLLESRNEKNRNTFFSKDHG